MKKRVLFLVDQGRFLRSVSDIYEAEQQLTSLIRLSQTYCERHGTKRIPKHLVRAESEIRLHLILLRKLSTKLRKALTDQQSK